MADNLMRLWRSARGCCLLLAMLALLLALGACVAFGWGLARWTEAAHGPALDVILVLDQSGSLWELGGVGTDPQGLRMEGARLFAAALGVDGNLPAYRLGVVYFGTEARLVAPLTELTRSADQRGAMLAALAEEPQPMGWTDVSAALALARQELLESERSRPDSAKALVLFTDGRPQTPALAAADALRAYMDALRRQVQALADEGVEVHAVLLVNPVNDADPLLHGLYRPLWISLAAETPRVHVHEVRSAADLPLVYHTVLAGLQRTTSQGLAVRQEVADALEASIEVAAGWQSATFVVHTTGADLRVTLEQPDGRPLRADTPGVRHSRPLEGRYETWTVQRPMPGRWRLRAAGQGIVTVWLDYRPLPPTPTATATSSPTTTPTASPTSTPTASPTPTPTATPSPTPTPTVTPLAVAGLDLAILQPLPAARVRPGEAINLAIRVRSNMPYTLSAHLADSSAAVPGRLSLVHEQPGAPGLDLWGGTIGPLSTAGTYTVTVHAAMDVGRGVTLHQVRQATITIEERRSAWPWLAAAGLLGVVTAVVGLRSRRFPPPVPGMLRVTQGPSGSPGGQRWDLSQRRRSQVTLGRSSRCEVALPQDPDLPLRAAVIRCQVRRGEPVPYISDLTGQGLVRVNGQPVAQPTALYDGDLLELGSYALRYENLALRRPQPLPPPHALQL
ncbi:MAG: VWA domain-containing protein [Anaerolineae bacterium]|nr:VWA domain-containing protein [Anaerolineae bacterium]